jgi:hypothetical protein
MAKRHVSAATHSRQQLDAKCAADERWTAKELKDALRFCMTYVAKDGELQ